MTWRWTDTNRDGDWDAGDPSEYQRGWLATLGWGCLVVFLGLTSHTFALWVGLNLGGTDVSDAALRVLWMCQRGGG